LIREGRKAEGYAKKASDLLRTVERLGGTVEKAMVGKDAVYYLARPPVSADEAGQAAFLATIETLPSVEGVIPASRAPVVLRHLSKFESYPADGIPPRKLHGLGEKREGALAPSRSLSRNRCPKELS